MKKCARCDYEYDDAYDGCPQCARGAVSVDRAPTPPAVPLPAASPTRAGSGLYVASVVLAAMTALLCVFSYPFRQGGVLGYLVNAVSSLWWIGALACAFAARRKGRAQALTAVVWILGVALVVGAILQVATSSAASAPSSQSASAGQSGGASYTAPSTFNGLPNDFWGVVVASIPESAGDAYAQAETMRARLAAAQGTAFVARSSDYPSLRSGYLVVFYGPCATGDEAKAQAQSLSGDGFSGAYPRRFTK